MHRPFAVLEEFIREGRITFPNWDGKVPTIPNPEPLKPSKEIADEDLFGHAMKDVKALGWSAVPLHPRPPLEIEPQNDEEDALRALKDFLRKGNPSIELTAEYI